MNTNPDDNDVSEMWREYHKERQEKRASNRENGPTILKAKGYTFDVKNEGAHLIVQTSKGIVDFWPGTGKWCIRDEIRWGRGVKSLLGRVKPKRVAAP